MFFTSISVITSDVLFARISSISNITSEARSEGAASWSEICIQSAAEITSR